MDNPLNSTPIYAVSTYLLMTMNLNKLETIMILKHCDTVEYVIFLHNDGEISPPHLGHESAYHKGDSFVAH